MTEIKVTVNGEEREIQPPGTVAGLLEQFRLNPAMVVVERNGEIVQRTRYGAEPVAENDRLEIVQMMAGG